MSKTASEFTLDRWTELCERNGARFDPATTFDLLARAYAEPHRAYHDRAHIDDCLGQFDTIRDLCDHPDEVEFAIWFHDLVYRPRAGDNEAVSARRALEVLGDSDLSADALARIEEIILATVHAADAPSCDAALMVDVDLSILGRDEARFDEYEAQVRREYRWVPGPIFRSRRRELLEAFLARPRLYTTDAFFDRYEAAARANLRRSIERLRQAASR